MKRTKFTSPFALLALCLLAGCRCGGLRDQGPAMDRPFPLGHVSDAHWETQQTNAEASDFIFYDHEFTGETADLTPGAKQKLMQVALRYEHVPFPVVVEQSPHNRKPQLDAQRRRTIVEQLARLGVEETEQRVIIAPAIAEGITSVEAEWAYYQTLYSNFQGGGGAGRRFGGRGGMFR